MSPDIFRGVSIGTDGEIHSLLEGPVQNQRVRVEFVDSFGQAACVDFHTRIGCRASLEEPANFRFEPLRNERFRIDGSVNTNHIGMGHAVIQA